MVAKPALRERTEQMFFDDPAVDRLMAYVFSLSAEVYVLRDRIARLEETLVATGTLKPGATEAERAPDTAAAAAEDRARFVAALMETLVARQASNGAERTNVM